MRAIKSLLAMTAVAGLVAITGVRSFAGPLMPSLTTTPVAPVAGETSIVGFGNVTFATVDWLVLPPGDYGGSAFEDLVDDIFGTTTSPLYIYAYQIEPLINDIENWTVNFTAPYPYIGTGTSFFDLDDVGHDATTFANLGSPPPPSESENPSATLQSMLFGPINKADNVTYDFDGALDVGEESEVLWITSENPPIYWIGALSDGLPSPGTGLVPVPSPEPGTFVLLMMGIVGLGGVVRLRRKV